MAPFSIMLLSAMHINPSVAAGIGVTFAGGSCVSNILTAILCDRVGRRPIAIASTISVILICYPYFLALNFAAAAGNTTLIALITFLMGFGAGGWFNGIAPAIMTESFETKYRISGAGLSFQFAGLTIGVITSFIASAIVASGPPTQVWPLIAGVNLICGLVGLVGALLLKETKDVEL